MKILAKTVMADFDDADINTLIDNGYFRESEPDKTVYLVFSKVRIYKDKKSIKISDKGIITKGADELRKSLNADEYKEAIADCYEAIEDYSRVYIDNELKLSENTYEINNFLVEVDIWNMYSPIHGEFHYFDAY